MLIGQDRAGKTSLKKSILGLLFDPDEPSTSGIEVDLSRFCVDVDHVVDWQKKEEPTNEFAENITSIMIEDLKPRQEIIKPRQEIIKPEPFPVTTPKPKVLTAIMHIP
jgi:hypothetical protein